MLAARGQRVVLIFATDGLPTSASSGMSTPEDKQRMVAGLRRLMTQLSVFVVIRLCTDDSAVKRYYNSVDEELELSLEVLDDIENEAKEIRAKGNGWVAYSPLLHRIREGGTFMKLFDFLDERRLTPVEVSLVAQLLLRGEGEPPMPHAAEEFLDALEGEVGSAPAVYDPLRRRMGPPVHTSLVRWTILPVTTSVAVAVGSLLTAVTSFLCSSCESSDPRVLGRTPSDVIA